MLKHKMVTAEVNVMDPKDCEFLDRKNEFSPLELSIPEPEEKSKSWKNNNNLKIARDHFDFRTNDIKRRFKFELWSPYGLNWPEWEFIRKMICHCYGTSTASGISDDLLDEANGLGIRLIDEIFDVNEKTLERMSTNEK